MDAARLCNVLARKCLAAWYHEGALKGKAKKKKGKSILYRVGCFLDSQTLTSFIPLELKEYHPGPFLAFVCVCVCSKPGTSVTVVMHLETKWDHLCSGWGYNLIFKKSEQCFPFCHVGCVTLGYLVNLYEPQLLM